MTFSFEQIDAGLFRIEKTYSNSKATYGSDISGPYWMLIEVEVRKGAIWWLASGQPVQPAKPRMFIFVPAFSWAIENYASGTDVRVRGLISKTPLPPSKTTGPILFYSDRSLPKDWTEVLEFMKNLEKCTEETVDIGVCSNPSSLSVRTKKWLDRDFASGVEIQDIAVKLKTSSAVISRTFKRDFGQSPAFYRKGLRVTVGMYELMMGTPPLEAAALAGYRDLSRFYKQFKAYLKQTPAEYLTKSKNAKTHT